MARILILYKQFPAPSVGHAGGESLFGLMAALHRRGHTLALAARLAPHEQAQLPVTAALCERVVTVPHHCALPGPRPLAFARSYLRLRQATAALIREWRPDLVHVETTQTAAALIGLPLPPGSFRTQDVNWFMQEQQAAEQSGARRWLARLLALAFRRSEPWLYRRYPLLLAISEGDRRLLAPICGPRQKLLLLPLAPLAQAVNPAGATHPPTLLFVGALGRAHNVNGVLWFLDHVWPQVRAAVPAVRFAIVGGNPPPEVRARASDAVQVTGFVEDLAAWYGAATVFVSPLRVAGGLLQKVMDALACGVPVVATSVCNHGLSATPGEHLLVADTPEAFAAAVVRLLQDAALRARLAQAGRTFIATTYDMETALTRWETALLALR